MRLIAVFLLVIFASSPVAIAYPQEQLKECILGSKQNPVILGVPEISIENFCDCALKLIVDEGRDRRYDALVENAERRHEKLTFELRTHSESLNYLKQPRFYYEAVFFYPTF